MCQSLIANDRNIYVSWRDSSMSNIIELQKAKCALNFNQLGNYENVFKNNTLSFINFKAANKR